MVDQGLAEEGLDAAGALGLSVECLVACVEAVEGLAVEGLAVVVAQGLEAVVEAVQGSVVEAAQGSVAEAAQGSVAEAAQGSVVEAAQGSVAVAAKGSVAVAAKGSAMAEAILATEDSVAASLRLAAGWSWTAATGPGSRSGSARRGLRLARTPCPGSRCTGTRTGWC